MKHLRLSISLFFALALSLNASAQFYFAGDEATRVKWRQIETGNFRIIYPVGTDSLAKEYGRVLEVWRTPVGQSVHYLPGEYTKGKIPVILHAFNSYANGSVAWAPKRMDLYTLPDAYPNAPMSWDKMLAIHESRHVAQMQLGLSGSLRPFNWFFGEMFNGATAGVYGHPSWLEGDAVVTETALTNSGRGRTADFLNYYRIAFDNGDLRDINHWFCDSFTKYHPNKYALGYLMLSGFRYYYDDRDFMGNSRDHYSRKIFDILNHYEIRKISGLPLWNAFDQITPKLAETWTAEMDARAPFMPMEQITAIPRRGYTRYSDLARIGDDFYAVRKSMYRSSQLVRIDTSGKVKHVREASSYASNLRAVNDTLWWSETTTGPRWTLSNNSSIRYTSGKHGRVKNLVRKGHFYNPAPSASGKLISAAEYSPDGKNAVNVYSSSRELLRSYTAPDGLQVMETAWIGDDRLFAACLSDDGYGIYEVDGWKNVLAAGHVMVINFGTAPDGKLMFTSDRSGEHELYTLSPDSGEIMQLTNTRYGAKSYQFSEDGKWLYYIAEQLEGQPVFRTPTDSLPVKMVDFSERHEYFLAENLSRQERTYEYDTIDTVCFTEPKKYSKIRHAFNFHSWAPIYFNVDNISDMSFDNYYSLASLGATALSQNELGSTVFWAGYSAHKDHSIAGKWRHSVHAKVTYTGLYPIIEAGIDYNDRSANNYLPLKFTGTDNTVTNVFMYSRRSGRNAVEGHLLVYVPLSWSRSGIHTGFIPQIRYAISNDRFDTGYVLFLSSAKNGELLVPEFKGGKQGKSYPFQSIKASIRGYVVSSTAECAKYPRFGIGAETGLVSKVGLKQNLPGKNTAGKELYRPTAYAYVYGYLPGFIPSEGWKITAKYQHSFSGLGIFWNGALNLLPRGMQDNSTLMTLACNNEKDAASFGIDYSAPFPVGDLCIGRGLLFMKSMTLTPHFDMMFNSTGNLYSAGTSLTLDLSRIAWIPISVHIGATYSYNNGSAYDVYEKSGAVIGHHYVGPVFSMDF